MASPSVRMPPSPPIPKTLQKLLAVLYWRGFVARLTRRYGAAFTIEVPVFGTAVVITDPSLVKQVYLADPEDIGVRVPNQITRVVGPGSVQGLNGVEHRRRRDLLSPIFHGSRLRHFEPLFVEETLAEIENWPDGEAFATYPSMQRITLNAILRTVFGEADAAHDQLRRIIPRMVKLGSRLAPLPMPSRTYGRYTPWGRFARLRARYDAVVDDLVAQLRIDPNAEVRTDVLAELGRTDADGNARSGMSRQDLGDELLGLVAAGHEITAGQLPWIFERISRHPELLDELVAEADAGGSTLRRATIFEVLRTRNLSGFNGRQVRAPAFQLGDWVLPRGCIIRVVNSEVHRDASVFPDPDAFDPRRFLDGRPSPFAWIPYGGGTRRCPGSSFANLQMDVVLRTVLQHSTIEPTSAPGEKWRSRGVAFTAAEGGRITVHRRTRKRRLPVMPPGPPIPRRLQSVLFIARRREFLQWLTSRYGSAFTINASVFGATVIITDPDLARQVYLADPDKLGRLQPNHARLLGSGSMFALGGAEHRRRRDLLGPPLHGERVRAFEPVFIEETLAEIAGWPDDGPVVTLDSMMRIAVNAIMRAVFGVAGAELAELRELILAGVTLGSRLVRLPMPSRTYGRYTPWGRLAAFRARYEAAVDQLVARARADPDLDQRTDLLAVMLRTRYEDGTVMTRKEIGDELLTLLAAGHENVGATLAWTFERISRYPQLLAELAAEVAEGGSALRRATIREVQRIRTVTDFAGRRVYAPTVTLGQWVLPRGTSVLVALRQIHRNPAVFADPDRFDPRRYLDDGPSPFEWMPYGGGTRRCPGSAFANLEMDVILRTVLQHFVIQPSGEPAEKWHSRGVAFTPALGGRVDVRRRDVSA